MKKGVIIIFMLILPMAYAEEQIIGLTETVILFTPEGPKEILATIDTGADSSTIDAGLAEEFSLVPKEETITISDSRGKETRKTIDLHFMISDQEIYTIGSISNRSLISTKMLIGEKDLEQFLVNPTESQLTIPKLPAENNNRYPVMINNILQREYMKIILIIPILSALIIVLRHIIGVQTYGVFGPLVIALSLMEMGILYGLFFYILLICVGLVIKIVLKRFHLPIISEISILMFFLSLSIIILSILYNISSISITKILFPLIITSFLIERLSQALEVHTLKEAFSVLGITLLTSVVLAYLSMRLVSFSPRTLALLFTMSFVLVLIVSNYIGLRLTEIFRFKLYKK